jgi:ADP-ribosylglycohydrolase
MKNATKSKVMAIANRLTAQGYSRPAAMVKAWALVKLGAMETKVAGVTFGNRQKAIQHLARYAPEAISIRLEQERANEYDRNTVAVWAAVEGKGSYHMGYLPRSLAIFVAPLMDAEKAANALFREVRGGGEAWMNYGLRVEVRA